MSPSPVPDTPMAFADEAEPVDVCVAGAGPTGLMLGSLLSRFGLHVRLVDERPTATSVGRADGLQPKTLETLQMMRLGDDILRTGARVFDICMWDNLNGKPLHRQGRQPHYPADVVDVLHPYILLCHQGMVESLLVEDMHQRGVEVQRGQHVEGVVSGPAASSSPSSSASSDAEAPITVQCRASIPDTPDATVAARYVVGCEGAHSRVRDFIVPPKPKTSSVSSSAEESVWGVLDGELDTDFPDVWSKTVVFSEQHGSVLLIPRERNMTRLYIELKDEAGPDSTGEGRSAKAQAQVQDDVMAAARRILAPFRVDWRTVEWFGHYRVAQRVAERFADPSLRVFIGGDASHTHSPKAAQGMNTGLHDAWNLAWKLNLAARGLARPALLESYGLERGQIARDLIAFDYEHANQIAHGEPAALAENFRTNLRFISGVGVEYRDNVLVPSSSSSSSPSSPVSPGLTLPPARATRYVDANVVDLQLDIPVLGQFRIYVLLGDLTAAPAAAFLRALSDAVLDPASLLARLSAAAADSYARQPRLAGKEDVFFQPQRYTSLSELFTFALITSTEKSAFEIADLPPLLSHSPWTVYLDDVPQLDTRGIPCIDKWVGALGPGEAAIMNVRPDGYLGSVHRFDTAAKGSGAEAAAWLASYYDKFLGVAEE